VLKICLLLSLLVNSVAFAASFDCSKAKTPQEKAICASQELSAADDKMAATYKTVLAGATPEIAVKVRDGQRIWLRALEDHCVIRGAGAPTAQDECLLGYYEMRTAELQRVAGTNHDAFITRFIYLTWPDAHGEGSGLEENHGFGTLQATWPESTIDAPEWRAWSKAIEAAAQSLVRGGKNSLSGEWLKQWAADGDFEIGASVVFYNEDLVTASIGIEGTGHFAAHPSEYGIEFNWLLKQNRELRTEDVFRKDSQWERAIEALCSKQLQESDADRLYDDWEKALSKVVLDPRNWRLNSEGLTIDFPEYTVSPRVAPVSPVMIPWATLRPLLDPSFTIPH